MSKQLALIKSLQTGAGNVVKSFFTPSFDSTTSVLPQSWRGFPNGMVNAGGKNWLFDTPEPGYDTYFNFSGLADIVQAYESCSPIFSIVNTQAMDLLNGKIWILDAKNKEVKSPIADNIRALRAKPNYIQNDKQFRAQRDIYLRLFGFCVILPITPKGFGVEDATTMWIIPPFICEFEYNDATLYNLQKGFVKRLKISCGSEVTYLNPDQFFVIRDISPSMRNIYLPQSPIQPCSQQISNLMGIYNSKGMLINYRGALGIISPEVDPNGAIAVDKKQKEEIQNGLMRYGLKRGQWKFIVSSASVKWQPMGIPYKDLMFTEWAQDDTMLICDVLQYPYKLLSNSISSSITGTELNAIEARQYQKFTIPYAEMVEDQMSEMFNLKKYGWHFDVDFSKVAVLQKDELKKAQARLSGNNAYQIEFYNNLITLDRWNELNGEDPIPGGIGKKYYRELVAEGWVFGKAGGMQLEVTDSSNDSSKEKDKK